MKQWFFLFSFLMAVNSAHAFNPDFDDLNTDNIKTILTEGREARGGALHEKPVVADISYLNPEEILASSTASFQYGIPDFLEDQYNLYPKLTLTNPNVKTDMVTAFKSGTMFLPKGGESPEYKASVSLAFDHLLNHFDWSVENGYSTNIMPDEIATTLVTRARLEKLKALWQ